MKIARGLRLSCIEEKISGARGRLQVNRDYRMVVKPYFYGLTMLFHAVIGYATSADVGSIAVKEVVTTGIKRATSQRDPGVIAYVR